MKFYLDSVNPLRGASVQTVISMLEMGQVGFYSQLQWLFYFIEKRDPMVRAVKRRLLSALSGLDWDRSHWRQKISHHCRDR